MEDLNDLIDDDHDIFEKELLNSSCWRISDSIFDDFDNDIDNDNDIWEDD
jgi:hypothetical protein